MEMDGPLGRLIDRRGVWVVCLGVREQHGATIRCGAARRGRGTLASPDDPAGNRAAPVAGHALLGSRRR